MTKEHDRDWPLPTNMFADLKCAECTAFVFAYRMASTRLATATQATGIVRVSNGQRIKSEVTDARLAYKKAKDKLRAHRGNCPVNFDFKTDQSSKSLIPRQAPGRIHENSHSSEIGNR
jgi:hypothetical protein